MSAVPLGTSIEIWRTRRFLGSMSRALGALPGNFNRIMPCSIGASNAGPRDIDWNKSCHGLSSRLQETSSLTFLTGCWPYLRCDCHSGAGLLHRERNIRYYFASSRVQKVALPKGDKPSRVICACPPEKSSITVVPGGRLCPRCPSEGFVHCMCTRVVTYKVLSAQSVSTARHQH